MDIIINKGLKKKQSQLLLFLVIIIVGIAFIAHLFPLFDLVNSSKRALFKFYPIIILYLIESPTLHWLSHKLNFLYNDMKEISTQSWPSTLYPSFSKHSTNKLQANNPFLLGRKRNPHLKRWGFNDGAALLPASWKPNVLWFYKCSILMNKHSMLAYSSVSISMFSY